MRIKRRGGATLVAAGILLSRLAGLVRESVFSNYFGLSAYADVFRVAFRIPNMLQNLFGEGVLSASFIPVYAKLLADGDEEEAGRVAGAVFSILALFTAVLVLAGVLATPYVIDFIASGLDPSRHNMAIPLVRIFFPGAGFLVMSAWCLGILNSHRRFFLSYSAPVLWNLIMIGSMLAAGRHVDLEHLAIVVAWASVAGSAAQFLIQLPYVLALAPRLHIAFAHHLENVRIVIRNFVPVFVSRGVVQLSALIDMWLASYLPVGAIAALQSAQILYLLPISLFGMSISASELPEMSSATTTDTLRTRLTTGLRRICFFVIPSVVGFIALGDVIVGAIFQHGKFTAADTRYVWIVLAGSGIGLLASTQGRLFSSAFYALRDTKTPLKFAIIRVALTTILGYLCARTLPPILGIDPRYGAAGLTASAGVSGWIEFLLLRHSLSKRIGGAPVGKALLARLWGSAIVAAAVAWAIKLYLPIHNPKLAAVEILIPFGAIYILLTGPGQWKSIR
ncbi:MAG TPA: murein biosynthesis integral membrane protein MurJ [Bryobacteraceae bacterium]|nr:murein biosynthesis integral membrane protein MurJ [Bryobacteraceae bacterium]